MGKRGRRRCMYARLSAKTNIKASSCRTIHEEPAPNIADLEQFKRHHRPTRTPLPRSSSAPQLIFTTTTAPIHIHRYLSFPSFLVIPAQRRRPACRPRLLRPPPTMRASGARATSTSRPLRLVWLQSLCAMNSLVSSPP